MGRILRWQRFYDNYNNWDEEYAKVRIHGITDFGNDENEIIEVMNELYYSDEYQASIFIQGAIDYGIRFGEDNLNEIASSCNKETTRNAIIASNIMLSDECLEELYGNVDDDVIIEVANTFNFKLPEDLREEDEADSPSIEDISYEVRSAIESANYAIGCLNQVQVALQNSSNIGVIDMYSKGFFASFMKHTALEEAQYEIQVAQNAIEGLNNDLKSIMQYKKVKLSYPRLTSVVDLWFDSDFLDYLSVMQIGRLQKNVRRVSLEIESIRKELYRLL